MDEADAAMATKEKVRSERPVTMSQRAYTVPSTYSALVVSAHRTITAGSY